MIGIVLAIVTVMLFGAIFGTVQRALGWKIRRGKMRAPMTTKVFVDPDGAQKDLWEFLRDKISGDIHIPLTSLLETDGTNIVAALGVATTPKLDMSNGDTDSHLEVLWAASNSDAILFQTPIWSLDTDKPIQIQFQAIMAGDTDTPTIAADTYFDRGDTKVEDTSDALGDEAATQTITIAPADIPTGARMMTCELTPGAHTTDTITIWDIRVNNYHG